MANARNLSGLLVSGPLNHVLYDILNKVFAGKTGPKAKLLQLLASNLIISPIFNCGKYSIHQCLDLTLGTDSCMASVHFRYDYHCWSKISWPGSEGRKEWLVPDAEGLLGYLSHHHDLCSKLFASSHLGSFLQLGCLWYSILVINSFVTHPITSNSLYFVISLWYLHEHHDQAQAHSG